MGVGSHLNCCKPLFESVSVEFDDKQKPKKRVKILFKKKQSKIIKKKKLRWKII